MSPMMVTVLASEPSAGRFSLDAGTSLAMGLPRLVMVISCRRCLTRSSNLRHFALNWAAGIFMRMLLINRLYSHSNVTMIGMQPYGHQKVSENCFRAGSRPDETNGDRAGRELASRRQARAIDETSNEAVTFRNHGISMRSMQRGSFIIKFPRIPAQGASIRATACNVQRLTASLHAAQCGVRLHHPDLRHHHHIAPLQDDVLFQVFSFLHVRIPEDKGFLFAIDASDDLDLVHRGVGVRPAGHAEGLYHVNVAVEVKLAGPVDLADHVDSISLRFLDGDIDGRIGDVLAQFGGNIRFQLLNGLASGH